MQEAIIGALSGSVLGLLGGVYGTYTSIHDAKGPKERAFLIKMAQLIWINIILFIALLTIVPVPYKFMLWIPYSIVLPVLVIKAHKNQKDIRSSEQNFTLNTYG